MNIVLPLLGGLGLFLFGMRLMSEGLEKAAGSKMRNILEVMTKNRLVGVLVGAIFTAVIQSSSAATVMVVSFVNAGLMTLSQSVGVIMGANIGTTITSQLVAFNLSEVAPVFLFIGIVMVMFSKKPLVKKIGEVVLGFGVLFMGLTMMKDSMGTLNESPVIMGVLSNLKNPLLAIFVGFLITAVVQSSSVTVSIVLVMATQGLLTLPICFYMILGCNIGACASALLASLNGKKNAKRAALIHFSFNVIGTILMALVLLAAMEYVEAGILALSGGSIGRSVANAHTLFKIAQVIVLFPFANVLVKLVTWMVPGEDKETKGFSLKYIGKNAVYSSATAVVETMYEIQEMGNLALQNLEDSIQGFFAHDMDKVQHVYETEKYIDYLSKEITDYLVKINQKEQLSLADSLKIGGLFHVVNDIERIGDHAENFADFTISFEEEGLALSKKAFREFSDMYGKVRKLLELSLEMFRTGNKEYQKQILALEDEVDNMERELQKTHVRRMAKGKCTPQAGVIYTDMVTGLERVADHATNIAFSILDSDPAAAE